MAFDDSKDEMIPVTRRRKHNLRTKLAVPRIIVRGQNLGFNTGTTRWQEVYLDTGLQF